LVGTRDLSFFWNIQTHSGTHPHSYSVDTCVLSWG